MDLCPPPHLWDALLAMIPYQLVVFFCTLPVSSADDCVRSYVAAGVTSLVSALKRFDDEVLGTQALDFCLMLDYEMYAYADYPGYYGFAP